MKKSKFILGVVAAAAIAAMTGCNLELENAQDRATVSGYAVTSIEVSGQTTTFQKGADFSLGNGVVSATYADGSVLDVTDDVTVSGFSSAAVTEALEVTVSYTDNLNNTVTTSYEVKITNPVASISVTTQPTKTSYDWYFLGDYKIGLPFDSTGMVVTATYEDDTSAVVDNSELTIDSLAPTAAGNATLNISYGGKSTEVTVTVTEPSACGYTGSYTSSAWWTEVSSGDTEVAVGEAVYTKFTNNSYGSSTWSGTVFRIADSTSANEFAVCRNDNFGWGDGYTEDVVLDSDWNWDTFIAEVTGSTESVVVVNNGDTIDLYLFFEKDGELIHHQFYKGIVGDGNAIQFRPMSDAGADITYCE